MALYKDFKAYHDEFFERVTRFTNDDSIEYQVAKAELQRDCLVRLLSKMAGLYDNVKIVSTHHESDDDTIIPDFFAIKGGSLKLYAVDTVATERGSSTIDNADVDLQLRRLSDFITQAIELDRDGVTMPGATSNLKHLCSLVAALKAKPGSRGITDVTFVLVTLNDVVKSFRPGMNVEGIRVRKEILTLERLYSQNIVIPVLNADELMRPIETEGIEEETVDSTKGRVIKKPQEVDDLSAEGFRQGLLNSIRDSNGFEQQNLFEAFVKTMTEKNFIDEAVWVDERGQRVSNSRQRYEVHGYSVDDTNDTMRLYFVEEPTDDVDANALTQSNADKIFARMQNFVDEAMTSRMDGSLARIIRNRMFSVNDKFARFEFIILTLRARSARFQGGEVTREGVRYRQSIMDYRDLYDLSHSTNNLVVNFKDARFGGKGIELLHAIKDETGQEYDGYVGMISGEVLASIYHEFGSRVLDTNVRAFLQAKNKVNRGIQNTIKVEPQNFFAFNNGICATAESVDVKHLGAHCVELLSAVDFQIVNGGQTTASLHTARLRKVPLDKVVVPIKLTVISNEREAIESEEGVSKLDALDFSQQIAAFANSQNKVSASDLGSNTPFQIQFSKQTKDPAMSIPGSTNLSFWYYERTRGSRLNDKNREARKGAQAGRMFEAKYPRHFDKLQVAKWTQAWAGLPNVVSVGAQKAFGSFDEDVRRVVPDAEGGTQKYPFVTPRFVQHTIGKGILFEFLDGLVKSSEWWYDRGRSYKANIVAYSMAKLHYEIISRYGDDRDLDFDQIWREQERWMPPKIQKVKGKDGVVEKIYFDPDTSDVGIATVLNKIAILAQDAIQWEGRAWSDNGEWVKKRECWTHLRDDRPLELTTAETMALERYVVAREEAFDLHGSAEELRK